MRRPIPSSTPVDAMRWRPRTPAAPTPAAATQEHRSTEAGRNTGLHPSGDEGRPCEPGVPDQCRYPATTCFTWSQGGTMFEVSSCVRECIADFECAESQI